MWNQWWNVKGVVDGRRAEIERSHVIYYNTTDHKPQSDHSAHTEGNLPTQRDFSIHRRATLISIYAATFRWAILLFHLSNISFYRLFYFVSWKFEPHCGQFAHKKRMTNAIKNACHKIFLLLCGFNGGVEGVHWKLLLHVLHKNIATWHRNLIVMSCCKQGWRQMGGREGYSSPVGEPSPPVGENLTIRRKMNGRNNMKLFNFDSSCSLVAPHSQH